MYIYIYVCMYVCMYVCILFHYGLLKVNVAQLCLTLCSAMDCSLPGSSVHGIHGGSDSEESACNAGDPGFISGSERSPGERNGYPLQYSCLENSILLDIFMIYHKARY